MKFARFTVLLLALLSLSPIEEERALVLRVEEVVRVCRAAVTYRHLGGGLFEFTDTLTGRVFRRMVVERPVMGGKTPKKILRIDLQGVDTTGYGTLFSLLASVNLGHPGQPSMGFANTAGERFIAGGQLTGNTWIATKIYQYFKDNSFVERYAFPGEIVIPFGTGKLYSNFLPHLMADSNGSIVSYSTRDGSNLPVRHDAVRLGNNNFVQWPRLYDFDGDGNDEIVFRNLPGVIIPGTFIAKYDSARNRFRDVYFSNFDRKFEWGSWAVGDFDQDGRGEFVTTALGGYVHFVENAGNDSTYRESFTDTTRTSNGGFNAEGNDIDGDGRPECFVGSDVFGGLTNIAVYERVADDDFEVSLWIEITGIGALKKWIGTGDVDGDGKQELCVNIGGMIVVLKCTGNDDYKVLWAKAYPDEVGFTLFDLNGDGREEILINRIRTSNPRGGYTEVYGYNKPTPVEELRNPSTVDALNIRPLPADAQVTIDFSLSDLTLAKVLIYDAGGRLLRQRDIESTGRHGSQITLDTSTLESGIYMCVVRAEGRLLAKKFLVVR